MKAVKGKITGWMNTNNPLLRISIKDLCEHIFLRTVIMTTLNSQDHCAINKGRYQFSVDIQKVSRSFYGSKFMYGNWTFQWNFYSDVCNMHCGLLCLSMTPTKSNVNGKIVAVTNGKEFLRLQVKKPCEHLFLRPLFSSLMNVTKDCFVVKGHYKFHVDILGIAQSYFGGTFVFGNWTFKSLFYNEACNFSCANIQVILSPKKEH
ncbi:hypothetical protein HW555_010133 [Spodoptera exigua]|uniref:Uncharacterized protein n=1 Tax=Spodoptera exigua TaxID=7107 RepID=A0A835G7W3_SPOEX|nr:hypothetical protein HW555_010133 [Spodoptera exigua]